MQHITRKVLISGAAVSAAVSLAGVAQAKTYSVGSGRTYSSLQDLRGMLQPGDIVEIDGNATYAGGAVLDDEGTTQLPITIRGLRINGKRPILSGGTNTIEVRASHYVIEGLELTQGSSRCFYHHADDVVLRDSEVHDCPSQGVLGADSDSGSLLMEFVEVHHCGSGTQSHQIYMATDESTYPGSVFRMQHCYVHDGNGGNNVKSRAERNEIYCNWVEGAMYHELELIGPDDGTGTGGVREDSDVVGNVLLKQATSYVVRFGGDGTGETLGRYRFVNNTVLTQPGGSEVFRLFDGLESLEAHNNVFYGLSGGTIGILRDAEATWTHGRQIAGANNWVGPTSTAVPTEWTGTLQGTSPGFSAIDTWQLTPATGSPLIDAGTNSTAAAWAYAIPNPRMLPDCVPPTRTVATSAIARASVGKIDIGAFEYGAAGVGGQSASGGATSGTGGLAAAGGSNTTGGAPAAAGGRGQTTGGTRSSGGKGSLGGTGSGSGTGGSARDSGGATHSGGSGLHSSASGGANASLGGNIGVSGGTAGVSSRTGGASAVSTSGAVASGGAQGGNASVGGASATSMGGTRDPNVTITSENTTTTDKEGGCGCRVAANGPRDAANVWGVSIMLVLLARLRRRGHVREI